MSASRRRVVRGTLLGLPAAGLLGAGLGWAWLHRSLPALAGSLPVSGVSAAVEVVRDRDAIPHVFAQSDEDAQFGLGFVHAQDRLWQLELTRRAGSGRLAELFGPDALGDDRLLRAVGLRRAAERSLAELDPDTRRWLDRYAAGVNAGVASARVLPPELLLLGVEPEPWTAVDTLVTMKLLGWQLAVQYGRELLRASLAERLAPAQVSRLLGGDAAALGTARALFGAAWPRPGAYGRGARHSEALGSNAWAVNGARSESGKPLLANDPHLGLSMPAAWYLAHLSAPGLDVIGASVPGLPGVILGRNAAVAWGFTNNRADALDFYVERLDPADPERYLTPSGSEPFERLEETIRIRGADPVTLTVRHTRHGPVVSDVDDRALAPPGHVLSLAYAALLPGDTSVRFPREVARARDVDGVLEAARGLLSPPQNVIAADTAGGVVLTATGRVPLRASAHAGRALSPLPGWLAEHDWQGFVPAAALPTVRQLPNGVAVTANQDLTPPAYPHWLGADWAAPVRADRISAQLAARDKHGPASFAALQADERSQRAADLVRAWLTSMPREGRPPLEQQALERLGAWDFVMRADAPEPLIYARWLNELTRLVFEDELSDHFEDVVYEASEQLTQTLLDPATPFCDDVRSPEAEACPALVARALGRALEELSREHGDELDRWRWGAAHAAHFSHMPFGMLPVIGALFDTTLPSGGGNDTVNLAEYLPGDSDRPLEAQFGPSYRAIYDLAAPEQSSFILGVGQSGNPLSPYYRHFASRWQRGERVPMRTDRAAAEASGVGTLVLTPAPLVTQSP